MSNRLKYWLHLAVAAVVVLTTVQSTMAANAAIAVEGEGSWMQQCKVLSTGSSYPCSVGKSGITANKQEGDNATPAGNFLIRQIFYRADKLAPADIAVLRAMKSRGFPVWALTQDDGWVDDPGSAYYNKFIKVSTLKQGISHENLWRADDRYDVIAVIGYNDGPVAKGKGSAVFMHVATKAPSGGYMPTAGCIALAKDDLLAILATITPKTRIAIKEDGLDAIIFN